ncbi:hypothetical protein YC2023_067828 [Brassica napus]
MFYAAGDCFDFVYNICVCKQQGKIGGWIISRCHYYNWREIICSWVVEMGYAQSYATEEGSRRRHQGSSIRYGEAWSVKAENKTSKEF